MSSEVCQIDLTAVVMRCNTNIMIYGRFEEQCTTYYFENDIRHNYTSFIIKISYFLQNVHCYSTFSFNAAYLLFNKYLCE